MEILIGRGGEIAHVEGLAARVTGVVDAFHMYASMLERFRRIYEAVGVPPQSQPLAAVADDERVLLSCRAALRRAMQQLIAALQADHVGPHMNGGIGEALCSTGGEAKPLRPARAAGADSTGRNRRRSSLSRAGDLALQAGGQELPVRR